ncbi:exosome complex RNA-binding protein Csl4 [Candidatus Bathyarchaeota archaeon]|nr:exosome complex RNA-binding protein Csl4 [Candidatus Bathyarchaeota archaeon]
MVNESKEKKKVMPGEKLAVIEEYNKGRGSYQQNGIIRASEVGEAKINQEKRAIEVVKYTKELILPEEGLDVIAETGSVTRRDARVDIIKIDKKLIDPTYSGVLHVNEVNREFSRNLEMALRTGDIIKAKIINTKNRLIQLSMLGQEYGVLYAYCARCGTILQNDHGRLTCTKCNRVERRQIARNYGKEEIV